MISTETYQQRLARLRDQMAACGVTTVLLGQGVDMPWLCGARADVLERLTMLVVDIEREPVLVVPALEEANVDVRDGLFSTQAWADTEDPITVVNRQIHPHSNVAVGNGVAARFLLPIQDAADKAQFCLAGPLIGPLRIRKDDAEIGYLTAAAHAVDSIVDEMSSRPFGGRSEQAVAREFADRLGEHDHERVNFTIVASGVNGARPHHEQSATIIKDGDLVVCDIGGTRHGYCSDITRMFSVGAPAAKVVELYSVLKEAQDAAVHAAAVGTTCEAVDEAARNIIVRAGWGNQFIHRCGHGIGLEEHEEPYIVAGNATVLQLGHVFSIEPGIYLPGEFGMRLEDIVTATADGGCRLNRAQRDINIVD